MSRKLKKSRRLARARRQRLKRNRTALQFETLERRELLALTVAGDADHRIIEGDALLPDDMTLRFDVATSNLVVESTVAGNTDSVSFAIPNESLTIRLGDGLFGEFTSGDDSITILGLGPNFSADLIIDGQDGSDSIVVAGDLLTPGQNITLLAESIAVNSGVTVSTRQIGGSNLLSDLLTANSTGDSGAILLKAATNNSFLTAIGAPVAPAPVEITIGDGAHLLSQAEAGSTFAPGNITLTAEETSKRSLRLIPIGIDFKDASISIGSANLQGGDISITADATDNGLLSDPPEYVEGFLGNLTGLINQLPGVLISSFTGISASVMIRGAEAKVDLQDATITSRGNVNISSNAGADASLDSIAVSSPALPFGVAVGYGRATANAKVDVLGATEIVAGGNVSIGSSAKAKAKITSRVSSNLGINGKDVDPNDMSLAMSVANTELDSTTNVSESTTITAGKNVDVTARGNVDVKPDARTGAFGDGLAGIGVAFAFDESNVKATIDGTINAVGFEANSFLPSGAVDLIENTITLPDHDLNSGDVITYHNGGDTNIGGLSDGDQYTILVVDENTIQLVRVPSIDLDNSAVDPTATHTLNTFGNVKFTPAASGVIDVANETLTIPGHGFVDGQRIIYSAHANTADDGSSDDVVGLSNGEVYEVTGVNGDSFQLTNVLTQTLVDFDGPQPAGTHAFLFEQTGESFSPANDVNSELDTITIAGHGLSTGDAVIYQTDPTLSRSLERPILNEDGTPVTSGDTISITAYDTPVQGLDPTVTYFVTVVDANTLRLSESESDALSAGAIDLTSLPAGSIEHSIRTHLAKGITVDASLSASNKVRIDGKVGGDSQDPSKISTYTASATRAENLIGLFQLLNFKAKSIGKGDSEEKDNATNDKLSVGAGVGINYFEHDVQAMVGTTADLNSEADVTVSASVEQKTQLRGQSGAKKGGGGVSVAAAIVVGVYNNDVQAIVESGAQVDASNTIAVSTDVSYPLLTEPLDVLNPAEFFKGGIGGLTEGFMNGTLGFSGSLFNTWVFTSSKTKDGLAAVAGSLALTDYTNISQALIIDGAQINQDDDTKFRSGDQTVDVNATTSMELVEMAGIGSLGLNQDGLTKLKEKKDIFALTNPIGTSDSKGGVGGAALFTFFDNTTIARIDSNVDLYTKNGLTVNAMQDILSFAYSQSGGDAQTFGLSGSFTILNHESTTEAQIGSGATITGNGTVDVNALDNMTRISIAGAVQKGTSIGVGVSAAINVVDRNTSAFIGNADVTGTAGTSIDVEGDVNVHAETIGNVFTFSLAGAFVNNQPNDAEGEDALDSISLPSMFNDETSEDPPTSTNPPKTGIGIAGSASVNIVSDTTLAFINDEATILADDVAVTSYNDVAIISASGAVAVVNTSGSSINAGLAGAFSFNQLDQVTRSYVTGANITTRQSTGDDAAELTVRAEREGLLFAFSGGGAGGNAKNGVAAAGSVSINRIDNQTDAYLDGVTVATSGNIAVEAFDDTQIISVGGGATFPDLQGGMASYGFGSSIGLNQISNSTRAEIRGDHRRTRLGSAGNEVGQVQLEAINDNAIRALGVSAGAGQSVGGAFTLGINLISDVAEAGNIAAVRIANTDLDSHADVLLEARDDSNIQALGGALALGGDKLGFGAALGWNQISTETTARIENSDVTTTGAVTLSALATESTPLLEDKIVSASIGAVVANGFAIAGSLSINVIDATVEASVFDNSTVAASGDISVTADDESTIRAIGGGFALADTAAFGVAIGVNVIAAGVAATVDTATLSGASLEVIANSDSEITAISLGGSFSASTPGDTPDPGADSDDPLDGASLANLFDEQAPPDSQRATSIAGAGSISGNVITTSTQALLRNSQVDLTGTLDVRADGNSAIEVGAGAVALSFAGGGGGATAGSVGASLAANVIVDSIGSYVEGSTINAAGANIQAMSAPSIVSASVAGTGGVTASVDAGLAASGAGTISVNVITNSTEALVRENSTVTTTVGDVTVSADDQSEIISAAGAGTLAGAVGAGGGVSVAVGAAISFNTIITSTKVSVDHANIDSSASLLITASQDADISAASLGVAGSAAFGELSGKTFSLAGSATISTVSSDVEASVFDSTLKSTGEVVVSAENNSAIGSGAGGAAVGLAGGASGGLGGSVGAAFALNVVNNKTNALVEATDIDAGTALKVDAKSTTSITAVTLAVSGAAAGGADVTAAVAGAGSGSLNVVVNEVSAEIRGRRNGTGQLIAGSENVVSASGDVMVSAVDETKITAAAGAGTLAGSGGTGTATGAGLGGSMAINSITNTVNALVDGTDIQLAGSVNVSASSDSEILAVTVGLGLGGSASSGNAVGISGSGSGSGNGIQNDVSAAVRESHIQTLGAVNVTATNNSDIWAFGGGVSGAGAFGGSASGAVAVGASMAVNVVTNSVSAWVEGSEVEAGSVAIVSLANSEIIAATIGFAGTAAGSDNGAVTISLAGAGAINVITNDIDAGIRQFDGIRSNVQSSGDVLVEAMDESTIIAAGGSGAASVAGGPGGGVSTQAGASFALNVIANDLMATIDGADVASDTNVLVTSEAKNELIAVTIGFGVGGAGGVGGGFILSGGASNSVNTINNNIEASIVGGSEVDARNSVKTLGKDTSLINSYGGAAALGGGGGAGSGGAVSFGVSLAANEISNTINSFIDDSEVTAGVDVDVEAMTSATVNVITAGFAGSLAGGVGGGITVAGAGAASLNVITNDIEARIGLGSEVRATTGTVTLSTLDESSSVATAGAVAVGGAGGAGGGVSGQAGSSVATNVIANSLKSNIVGSTVTGGSGVNVLAESNADAIATSLGFAAGGSFGAGGGIQISAGSSISTNTINNATEAAIIGNSTVDSGAAVTLSAKDNSASKAFGGGASVGGAGGAGGGIQGAIGASIAVNEIGNSVKSYIDDSTVTAATGVSLDAIESVDAIAAAIGFAGGVAGGAGGGITLNGAGAVAMNIVTNDVAAQIGSTDGGGSMVSTTAGDVTLNALDESEVIATAGAASVAGTGGGGVGIQGQVGSSIATNAITNSVLATLDNSDITADDIRVVADEQATALAVALGFAVGGSIAGGGGFLLSGAGSIAANFINNSVEASIIGGSDIQASGEVVLMTQDNLDAQALGGGASGGAAVGAGGGVQGALSSSLAINEVSTSVQSHIDNSTVTAATGIHLDAIESADVVVATFGFAAGGAGGGGGGIAINGAGAGAVNVIVNDVGATVSDSTVTVSAGDLTVNAKDESSIIAAAGAVAFGIAGGGATSGTAQAGASFATNVITNSVSATIDASDVDTAGDVSITANETAEILAVSIGFGGGGSGSVGGSFNLSVGGSISTNVINNDVEASIENGSTLAVGAAVMVEASDQSKIDAFAGGAAAGGAGGSVGGVSGAVGASFAVNEIGNQVEAFIDDSTIATESNVVVSATESADILAATIGFAVTGAGGATGGVALAGAGAGSVNIITNNVDARIGRETEFTSGSTINARLGSVSLIALDDSAILATAGAIAASGAGGGTGGITGQVGASIATNVISNNVNATADGATIDAPNSTVSLDAQSLAEIGVVTIGFSGGGSGGATGGIQVSAAGSTSQNVIENSVGARVIESDVNARTVLVRADDNSLISALAGGASIGGAGGAVGGVAVAFAGSFAANIIDNETLAEVTDSTVRSVREVRVEATSDAHVRAATLAGAATISGGKVGGVSISGAGTFSVNHITTNVLATVAEGSSVTTSDGEVFVEAVDSSLIEAFAGAGTLAGAGGAVGFTVSATGAVTENEITTSTIASVVDSSIDAKGADGIGHLTVSALSTAEIMTDAIGFAGALSAAVVGISLAGVGAATSNIIQGDGTQALITNSTIDADGMVRVIAKDDAHIRADAGGAAAAIALAGGAVSLSMAASVAVNQIDRPVIANVSNSDVNAYRLDVNADSLAKIEALALAGSFSLALGGGGGFASAGTVAIAINQIASGSLDTPEDTPIEASVTNGSQVNVDRANVTATDLSSIEAIGVAGSLAISGGQVAASGTLAATAATNEINRAIIAEFDQAEFDGFELNVQADSVSDITSYAVASSFSGSFGGASVAGGGAGAENTIENQVIARLRDSEVNAATKVDIRANDSATISSEVGTGSIAIGLLAGSINTSIAENQIANDVQAVIEDSNVETPFGDINVAATSSTTTDAEAVATTVSVGIGGALGTAVATSTIDTVTKAAIYETDPGSKLTAAGAINVTADSTNVANADAHGATIGATQISFFDAQAHINGSTNAEFSLLPDDAQFAATTLNIVSTSDNRADADIVVLSAAIFGGSGGIASAKVDHDTTAVLHSGTTLDVAERVDVRANSTNDADAYAIGGSVGAVDVSVLKSEANITGRTTTEIGAGTFIQSDDILIDATSDNSVIAETDMTGIGLISGQGGLSSANVSHNTLTSLGNGSRLRADNSVEISSNAVHFAKALSFGKSAAFVGAAVQQAKADVSGFTQTLLRDVEVNTDTFILKAINVYDVLSDVITASGGFVNTSVAKASSSATPTIQNLIGLGSTITTKNLLILADSNGNANADSKGISIGAGAFVGSLAQATMRPKVKTVVGDNVTINKKTVSSTFIIQARHNHDGVELIPNRGALATAKSSAIGGVTGTGAEARAESIVEVETTVAKTATIHNDHGLKLEAFSHSYANANAVPLLSVGNLSLIGIGTHIAEAKAGGSTQTVMNGLLGLNRFSRDVFIGSTSIYDADANASVGAIGLLNGIGAITSAHIVGLDGNISTASTLAAIGDDAEVNADGKVTVLADSTATANAESKADTLGIIGVGVTEATSNSKPSVVASIGKGAKIWSTFDQKVEARHNLGHTEPATYALAESTSKTLLATANVNKAFANSAANVSATVGEGSNLISDFGDISILADSNNLATALADGEAAVLFSFVGIGITNASASSSGKTTAKINSTQARPTLLSGLSSTSDLIVIANSNVRPEAIAVASSGGVLELANVSAVKAIAFALPDVTVDVEEYTESNFGGNILLVARSKTSGLVRAEGKDSVPTIFSGIEFGTSDAALVIEPEVTSTLNGSVQAGNNVNVEAKHVAARTGVSVNPPNITSIIGTVSHSDPEIVKIQDPERFVSAYAFAAGSSDSAVRLVSGLSSEAIVVSSPEVNASFGTAQPSSTIAAGGNVTISSDSESDGQAIATNISTSLASGSIIARVDADARTTNLSIAILGRNTQIVADGNFELLSSTQSSEKAYAVGRADSAFGADTRGHATADARLNHQTLTEVENGASVDVFGDLTIDASDRTLVYSISGFVVDTDVFGAYSDPKATSLALVGMQDAQASFARVTDDNDQPSVAMGESSVPVHSSANTESLIRNASLRGSEVVISARNRQLEIESFAKGKTIVFDFKTNADGLSNLGVVSRTDVILLSGAEIVATDNLKILSSHQRDSGSSDRIRTSSVARGDTDDAALGSTDAIAANVTYLTSTVNAQPGSEIRTENLDVTSAIPKLFYHSDTDQDTAGGPDDGIRRERSRSRLQRNIFLNGDVTIMPFIELLIGEEGQVIKKKRVSLDAIAAYAGQRTVEAPAGPLDPNTFGQVTLNIPFPEVLLNDESPTGENRRTRAFDGIGDHQVPEAGMKIEQTIDFDGYNLPETGAEIRLVNRSDKHLRIDRLTPDTLVPTTNYTINSPRSLEKYEFDSGTFLGDILDLDAIEKKASQGGVGGEVDDGRFIAIWRAEIAAFHELHDVLVMPPDVFEQKSVEVNESHIATNALIRSTKKDIVFGGPDTSPSGIAIPGLVDLPSGNLTVIIDELLPNDPGGVQTRDGQLIRAHNLVIDVPGNIAVANNDTPDGLGFVLDPLQLVMVNDALDRFSTTDSTISIDTTRGDMANVDLDVRLFEQQISPFILGPINAADLITQIHASGFVKLRGLSGSRLFESSGTISTAQTVVRLDNIVSTQSDVTIFEHPDNAPLGVISAVQGNVTIFADGSIVDANGQDVNIIANNINLRSFEGGIGANFSGLKDTVEIQLLEGTLQAIARRNINLIQVGGELGVSFVQSHEGDVHLTTLDTPALGDNLVASTVRAAGSITLTVGDNFTKELSGVFDANQVTIEAVLFNADGDVGALFDILGTINSPTVIVRGTSSDDQINIARVEEISTYDVFAKDGDDVISLIPWPIFGSTTSQVAGTLAIHGEAGKDTVAGPIAVNTWNITGNNQGNVTGDAPFTFDEVESLIGNDLADTFVFSDQTSLDGMIDGRDDIDKLDYSAYTTPVDVDLLANFAGNVAMGVFNVEDICGPLARINHVAIRSTGWSPSFLKAIDPLQGNAFELGSVPIIVET